jgi:hypothetical protein
VCQLRERFSGSAGLQQYCKLERVLVSGTMDDEHTAILSMYPEIDVGDLKPQLQMFRRRRTVNTVSQAVVEMRNMLPEVRAEFPQVTTLLKLLIVSPASSAEAERSFSALRRLKTWLRSTMTETRLNAVSVCHVHQQKLDCIVIRQLMHQFVACNDKRKSIFGIIEL